MKKPLPPRNVRVDGIRREPAERKTPSTEKQSHRETGPDDHGRIFPQEKEGELHRTIFRVIPRDQLRFTLRKIKGKSIRLREHRSHEDDERNKERDCKEPSLQAQAFAPERQQRPAIFRLLLNDAPGQTLEPWEIVRDLVQATGGGNGIYAVTDIFAQLAKEVSEFSGLTWGQIGDLGLPLLETGVTIPLLEREKQRVASGLIVG